MSSVGWGRRRVAREPLGERADLPAQLRRPRFRRDQGGGARFAVGCLLGDPLPKGGGLFSKLLRQLPLLFGERRTRIVARSALGERRVDLRTGFSHLLSLAVERRPANSPLGKRLLELTHLPFGNPFLGFDLTPKSVVVLGAHLGFVPRHQKPLLLFA